MRLKRCKTVYKIDYGTVAQTPDSLGPCKLLNSEDHMHTPLSSAVSPEPSNTKL